MFSYVFWCVESEFAVRILSWCIEVRTLHCTKLAVHRAMLVAIHRASHKEMIQPPAAAYSLLAWSRTSRPRFLVRGSYISFSTCSTSGLMECRRENPPSKDSTREYCCAFTDRHQKNKKEQSTCDVWCLQIFSGGNNKKLCCSTCSLFLLLLLYSHLLPAGRSIISMTFGQY